jgi:hypothetical protein
MNVIVSNKNKDVFSGLDVDVLKSISGEFNSDEIIQTFSNFFFNRMFLDITAIKDYTDIKNIQKLSIGLDVSKIILLLNDNEIVNSSLYKSKLVSMGIYNFTNDLTGLKYLYDHPNSYKDVAHYQEINEVPNNFETKVVNVGVKIIGFKNVTDHAGSTSLIYMLKNELSTRYNVVAIEVNKKDFIYFNDKSMISINSKDLGNTILKYKNVDIVLVDLNDMEESTLDGDVLYLIEPSTLKLNKMMLIDRRALSRVSDKNVILNMCMLSKDDVKDFERETGCRVFYTLPSMSDKTNNSSILLPFLEKLGLVKKVEDDNGKKSGLFGFLKF